MYLFFLSLTCMMHRVCSGLMRSNCMMDCVMDRGNGMVNRGNGMMYRGSRLVVVGGGHVVGMAIVGGWCRMVDCVSRGMMVHVSVMIRHMVRSMMYRGNIGWFLQAGKYAISTKNRWQIRHFIIVTDRTS